MIFVEFGGQQLRSLGVAPEGRSGGPHVEKSGGDIGEARAKGLVVKVPQSPPRPIRTFLLFPITMFCSSSSLRLLWLLLLPLNVITWRLGNFLCLEDLCCFCENGYEEGEIFELEETLIVDIKERGEIDAMVKLGILFLYHEDIRLS